MSRNDNGGETIDSRGDTLIIPKFLLVPFLLPLATDDRRLIFSFFFFLLLAKNSSNFFVPSQVAVFSFDGRR